MLEELNKAKAAIKEAIEQEEENLRIQSLKGPHKHFDIGDLVKGGGKIGRVAWTQNTCCDIPYGYGRMGIDILTGDRGFLANAKRNDFEKVSESEKEYLETPVKIELELTGEEIEAVFSGYFGMRNVNHEKTRIKMLDAIEEKRIELDL